MSVLSDREILARGPDLIKPFAEGRVQPSSYDLSLSDSFALPHLGVRIDLRDDDPSKCMTIIRANEFIILPGESILGCTQEIVECPQDLSARVEGKSSLGRLFLAIHVTAGVVDAGFRGQITLEIVNHGPWEIVLYEGMKIAQLSYFTMTSPSQTLYGSSRLKSHYNMQMGATPAKGKRRNE
jgi:dCTP deaminase